MKTVDAEARCLIEKCRVSSQTLLLFLVHCHCKGKFYTHGMRNCFNGQGSETTAFLPDSGLSCYNLKPPQVPKNRFIGLHLIPRAHKVSGKTGCHNNGRWTFVSQVVLF